METNGVYADTASLRSLNQIGSDAVGASGIHHPYRFAREMPGKTVQNLALI